MATTYSFDDSNAHAGGRRQTPNGQQQRSGGNRRPRQRGGAPSRIGQQEDFDDAHINVFSGVYHEAKRQPHPSYQHQQHQQQHPHPHYQQQQHPHPQDDRGAANHYYQNQQNRKQHRRGQASHGISPSPSADQTGDSASLAYSKSTTSARRVSMGSTDSGSFADIMRVLDLETDGSTGDTATSRTYDTRRQTSLTGTNASNYHIPVVSEDTSVCGASLAGASLAGASLAEDSLVYSVFSETTTNTNSQFVSYASGISSVGSRSRDGSHTPMAPPPPPPSRPIQYDSEHDLTTPTTQVKKKTEKNQATGAPFMVTPSPPNAGRDLPPNQKSSSADRGRRGAQRRQLDSSPEWEGESAPGPRSSSKRASSQHADSRRQDSAEKDRDGHRSHSKQRPGARASRGSTPPSAHARRGSHVPRSSSVGSHSSGASGTGKSSTLNPSQSREYGATGSSRRGQGNGEDFCTNQHWFSHWWMCGFADAFK